MFKEVKNKTNTKVKPELKARRKAEYQDLVTSEPSEELIDPVY